MRFLIVKRGCPFCLPWTKAVNKINLKLPFEKRIKIFDNYEWEEFGIKAHPITEKLSDEVFDAYPFCYLDGVVVGRANYKIAESFLKGYFKDEFIVR